MLRRQAESKKESARAVRARITLVLRVAPLALSAVVSAQTFAQSLRDAVEHAVQTNPEVLATISRKQAVEEEVNQARGGYLPRIDANAGYGSQWLDSVASRALGVSNDTLWRQSHGLTLTQMLFDGFATRSEVSRQQARASSSGHRVSVAAEEIALRAAATYLDVLRRQQTLATAVENVSQHERLLELIRKRTTSGVGRRADQDQAEARVALARASMRAERGSLQDAQIAFARVVGKAPQSPQMPEVPATALPGTSAAALDLALIRNPLLKSVQSDLEAAVATREGARAALLPRLDFEVSSVHDRNRVLGRNYDTSALVRLRYNLFRGGIDTARIRETTQLIEEAKHFIERARREIEESVSLAYSSLDTARDRNIELARYVEASAATRDAYVGQFNIGQRSLLDLLNAENEYFNSRLAQITGRFTEVVSIYRVFAAVGTLRETLRVAAEPGALRPAIADSDPAEGVRTLPHANAERIAPGWVLK